MLEKWIAEAEKAIELAERADGVHASALDRHTYTDDAYMNHRIFAERIKALVGAVEAWGEAKKTLPPDPSLNEPWSQCIAIMDEAIATINELDTDT